MKLIVGLVVEKAGNPSAESVVEKRVRLGGGLELPSPLPALVGKTWTVPTPETVISSEPYVQVPAGMTPAGPENDEDPPTGVTPTVAATVRTPAPLVQ